VPQSIFLVDDSLRHNIAFGLQDTDIDEQRLQAAVRMAQLEEFVAAVPGGLDTIVGEYTHGSRYDEYQALYRKWFGTDPPPARFYAPK